MVGVAEREVLGPLPVVGLVARQRHFPRGEPAQQRDERDDDPGRVPHSCASVSPPFTPSTIPFKNPLSPAVANSTAAATSSHDPACLVGFFAGIARRRCSAGVLVADVAGLDHVDGDAVRRFLERERARERHQARFRRGIQRKPARGVGDRRAVHPEEDQPAVAALAHPRQHRGRHRDGRAEVALEHRAVVVGGAAREALHRDRSDGVHEHVDRPARRLGGGDRLARGFIAREVGRHGARRRGPPAAPAPASRPAACRPDGT